MDFISLALTTYCEQHSSEESALLKELAKETWQKVVNPRMLSGHLQGQYLSFLSQLIRPKRILEIGTFTGYSALCLADGLQENGELITIDENDELSFLHDTFLKQHPKGNSNRVIYGDAVQELNTLEGAFDLIFIDADKRNYLHYWEYAKNHLAPNGVILIDNVLWSGKVLAPTEEKDVDTQVLKELNERVTQDNSFHNVLFPLRDGLMMCRKK